MTAESFLKELESRMTNAQFNNINIVIDKSQGTWSYKPGQAFKSFWVALVDATNHLYPKD